jgi:hypothetical protein
MEYNYIMMFIMEKQVKKTLLCVAVVSMLGMVGCSSTNPPLRGIDKNSALEKTPDLTKAEATFVEKNGNLILEFDEAGNWIKIRTTGTSPIEFNHASAKEQAFLVAGMRAKRNLIEFLNNDVKSQKTMKNISQVYLKDILKDTSSTGNKPKTIVVDGVEEDVLDAPMNDQTAQESSANRDRANKVAMSVSEQITDNSQGIIKGVYISSRKIDVESNQASVEISVSRKSMNVAQQVRTIMDSMR